MTHAKLTDYTLDQFLKLTVEITYRNHYPMYSVYVPMGNKKLFGKTLGHAEKKRLWERLSAQTS